jgi:hypothetical protein
VITEGTTFCFGNTGQGFTIVSEQADGNWKQVTGARAAQHFSPTGTSAAGPTSKSVCGFCFLGP